MRDYVRDDVRDESLETPLYKGFLLKNVRDERLCSKGNNWEHNGESEEEFHLLPLRHSPYPPWHVPCR